MLYAALSDHSNVVSRTGDCERHDVERCGQLHRSGRRHDEVARRDILISGRWQADPHKTELGSNLRVAVHPLRHLCPQYVTHQQTHHTLSARTTQSVRRTNYAQGTDHIFVEVRS